MKSKILGMLALGLLILPMSSQATLLARDAAGNAVGLNDASRTFIYDTDLNITWLANWNANGAMDWGTANTWAANLSYTVGTNMINDWRLPAIVDTGSPGCNFAYIGTDCGFSVQTVSGSTVYSEMAHLWYVTLGNTAYCSTSGVCPQAGGGLTNTGPFLNMQPSVYWSSTAYVLNAVNAWSFRPDVGSQIISARTTPYYAVAVRNGDVLAASVPEPSTLALLLLGVGAVGAMRRRRPG